MPGKCIFRETWLTDEETKNVAKWLRPVAGNKYKAQCIICKSCFDISHSGFGSVKVHMEGKTHRKLYTELVTGRQAMLNFTGNPTLSTPAPDDTTIPSTSGPSKNASVNQYTSSTSAPDTTILSTSGPSKNASMSQYLINDEVTKAEILWAINKIMSHSSDRGACSSSDLFAIMFPDSIIAQKFKMQKDKLGYLTAFGLGPYFQEKLVRELLKCEFYCVSFDESLNKVAQKGQMDVLVRYWDATTEQVVTRYLTSHFLGHSTASDLLDAFKSGFSKLGLPLEKIVQISLDGPNVNLKFLKDFQHLLKELTGQEEKQLLDIGTCSLHLVHGSYKTAHADSDWKINNFLRSLYYLFKDFPSRRADYVSSSGSSFFPLKMCSIRWVENSSVLERAQKNYPTCEEVVKYVESNPPASKNYGIVKDFLADELLSAKLLFLHSVVLELEPYLTKFQSDNPLLPFVYGELYSITRAIADRFLKPEVMAAIKTVNQLLAVDVQNRENQLSIKTIKIGFGAEKALSSLKSAVDVVSFRRDCRNFLVALYMKLVSSKSPLRNDMVKGASCLSPEVMRSSKVAESRLDFALKALCEKNQIEPIEADRIQKAYLEVTQKAQARETLKTFDWRKDRLDTFLLKVFEDSGLRDDLSSQLNKFSKIVLTMFHSNASVERGFSVNKECLVENLADTSLISQRAIYSAVQAIGGIKNLKITKDMIMAARKASSNRREALKEKKRKEEDMEEKLKSNLQAIKDLKDKRKKVMELAAQEAHALDAEIQKCQKKMKLN